jgi:hypothetical protein
MAAGVFAAIRPFSREIFDKGAVLLPEGAAQTFKQGEPVIIALGYCTIAGAGFASIYGIAAEDAHNTALDGQKEVAVFLVDSEDLWDCVLLEAFAQTLCGVAEYGLVRGVATKSWYIATADVGDQAHIVRSAETIGGLVAGDTKTRVLIRFAAANIQNP